VLILCRTLGRESMERRAAKLGTAISAG